MGLKSGLFGRLDTRLSTKNYIFYAILPTVPFSNQLWGNKIQMNASSP
jgi:hypothetical protein